VNDFPFPKGFLIVFINFLRAVVSDYQTFRFLRKEQYASVRRPFFLVYLFSSPPPPYFFFPVLLDKHLLADPVVGDLNALIEYAPLVVLVTRFPVVVPVPV